MPKSERFGENDPDAKDRVIIEERSIPRDEHDEPHNPSKAPDFAAKAGVASVPDYVSASEGSNRSKKRRTGAKPS